MESLSLYVLFGLLGVALIFGVAWTFVKRARSGNEQLRRAQGVPKSAAHSEEPMS